MSVHQAFLDSLKNYPSNLTLPPLSMAELKIEFIEIIPGKKLVGKLPFQERFTNPIGTYQGGFLAAGVDEVFGPLSYMTSEGPTMTLSMNLTYLKTFTKEMGHCLIEGTVLKMTHNFIFMRAEVRSPKGDFLAHAESHVNRIKP